MWEGDCLGVAPPPGVTLGDGRGDGLGIFLRSCLTVPRRKRTLTGRLLRIPGVCVVLFHQNMRDVEKRL